MTEENNLQTEFASRFIKKRKSLPPEINNALTEALELFVENPDHPQLRNHSLRGKYSGYRSIDITADWRALFKHKKGKTHNIVKFYTLGTHTQLYGKI